ncbi:hypothetical protein F2Q70_00005877 [Brassica cretica]|uniref:NAC domain-containing protein n=1 Tax=Brassica cretica TaxID=69181 RepID=A0A8S9IY48_BRACR|nr:hypothetical protein F2Q70_00005877 [Brassica cretica]
MKYIIWGDASKRRSVVCVVWKESEAENSRPRHGYNISFDGSSNLESIEAKKAMALDKVAELWVVDPKRAKRRSWLVDSNRIATKIKNASAPSGVEQQSYKTLSQLVLYFFQEVDDWPGLPRGVKFDPSDPEIICHLLAKSGLSGLSSHPFTNELISAVNQDDEGLNRSSWMVPLVTVMVSNTCWSNTSKVDACFLPFHSLSATSPQGTEPSIKLMLPTFGLASSKRVQVDQPDYSFFTCNSPPMRRCFLNCNIIFPLSYTETSLLLFPERGFEELTL